MIAFSVGLALFGAVTANHAQQVKSTTPAYNFGTTFPMIGTQAVSGATWDGNAYLGTNLIFNPGAYFSYTNSYYVPKYAPIVVAPTPVQTTTGTSTTTTTTTTTTITTNTGGTTTATGGSTTNTGGTVTINGGTTTIVGGTTTITTSTGTTTTTGGTTTIVGGTTTSTGTTTTINGGTTFFSGGNTTTVTTNSNTTGTGTGTGTTSTTGTTTTTGGTSTTTTSTGTGTGTTTTTGTGTTGSTGTTVTGTNPPTAAPVPVAVVALVGTDCQVPGKACAVGLYCQLLLGYNPYQVGKCQIDAGNYGGSGTVSGGNAVFSSGGSCKSPSVCGYQSLVGSCWCDSKCVATGDCCADFVAACPGQQPAPPTPVYIPPTPPPTMPPTVGLTFATATPAQRGDCTGNCGKEIFHTSGACWCDPTCMKYGDCCWNFQRVCM